MKIAIIGAGPSGICTAKELQETKENYDITVFEQQEEIGGVFLNAYEGLQLVNNNLLISFSDFCDLPSEQEIKMWSAQEYVDYLKRYTQRYNIMPLIRFSSKVTKVSQLKNQWLVDVECNGKVDEYSFDFVVVCSGSHQAPNIPKIIDEEKFSGEILHSNYVKNYDKFKNKKVVILGLGEYASDVSYFISQQAESVKISLRNIPGYIIPRYTDGLPTDYDTTRLYHSLPKDLDSRLLGKLLLFKRKFLYQKIRNEEDREIQKIANEINYKSGNLSLFQRYGTKSANFIKSIIKGNLTIVPKIVKIEQNNVYFQDGSSFECDYIILCTGYKTHFPFLPSDLKSQTNNIRSLYRYMFPLVSKNIAFIGFVRPGIGSIPPISEMQARYLSLVLNKTIVLPVYDKMKEYVTRQEIRDKKQFFMDADRLKNLTDYMIVLTSFAKEIGCEPTGKKLLFFSPYLWFKVNCSFLCPAQYRLVGPGAKPQEAKKIIRQLPLPRSTFIFELLTSFICNILSFIGFKNYDCHRSKL